MINVASSSVIYNPKDGVLSLKFGTGEQGDLRMIDPELVFVEVNSSGAILSIDIHGVDQKEFSLLKNAVLPSNLQHS